MAASFARKPFLYSEVLSTVLGRFISAIDSQYVENIWHIILIQDLDPIYAGLVTTVQVLYLLEICCLGWVFIILYDEV